jgi:dephospho-CoA kinase
VKEAAVMIESGTYVDCDEIILVTSPIDLRMKRVMQRNNTTVEEIENRIKNQMNDEQRAAYCKYTVTNDEMSFVINQVLNLHNIFLS